MPEKGIKQIYIGVAIAVLAPIILSILYSFYTYVQKPATNEKEIIEVKESVENLKSSVDSVHEKVDSKPDKIDIINVVDSLLILHR